MYRPYTIYLQFVRIPSACLLCFSSILYRVEVSSGTTALGGGFVTNYNGVKCPVCNKRFGSADDVVVCPVCGAPHHRACYAERGECAFTADHMSGKEWTPPEQEETGEERSASGRGDGDGANARICSRCGSANPQDTIFCQVCGTHLNAKAGDGQQGRPSPFADPLGGVDKDEKIADISVLDMAQYVGQNSGRYLPKFRVIDQANAYFFPSLSALIFSFYFFFYRKMYAIGSLLLAVFILGNIPMFLLIWELGPEVYVQWWLGEIEPVFSASGNLYLSLISVSNVVNWVLRIFFCLFGTRFYFKHVVKRMHALSQQMEGESFSAYQQELTARGGVDRTAVILLVGFVFFTFSLAITLIYNL